MHDWTDFEYTRFGRYAHRLIPALRGEKSEGEGRITPALWHFTRFDTGIPFDEEICHLMALEDEIGHKDKLAYFKDFVYYKIFSHININSYILLIINIKNRY